MRRVLTWLVVLGATLTVIGILMFTFQRWLLFPRFLIEAPAPNAHRAVPGLRRLALRLPDGEVEAWLLPGRGVSARAPGPAVIFCHGNGELIDYWPELMAGYQDLGVTVLLPEYRGYGRSAGTPSEATIAADLEAFYDQLVALPEVDEARVVFHGRSIGGGAVCALARRRRPAALILMSTFTSIRAMARRYLMPGFLVSDPFDNLEVVSGYQGPLLLLHGRRDTLIPFSHAERLLGAAQSSSATRLIAHDDADHNSCPPDWAQFYRQASKFLKDSSIL